MAKRVIEVKDKTTSRFFEVENDIISLSSLKTYYPNISGLTYTKDEKDFCVLVENEKFRCASDINTYTIFTKQGASESPGATLSEIQKQKLSSIMQAIRSKETPLQQKEAQKKKRISDKPHPISPVTPAKKIAVQWHHRDAGSTTFYKMPGETKAILADPAVIYSVENIISMCISIYKNDLNSNYFEKSSVKIGKKNFDIIEHFGPGGFWDFYNAACVKAHRPTNLYLYTFIESTYITAPQTNAKENSSILLNVLPSCNSLFKTPQNVQKSVKCSVLKMSKGISNFKLSYAQKKPLESEESSPNKKVKSEYVRDVKMNIAVEVPIEKIHFTEILLGKGAFGEVRKALWCESDVAVKTMDVLQVDPKNIIKELAILSTVQHQNIVLLMGYAFDSSEFHLIMEFINGYTLSDLIFKRTVKEKLRLDESDKMKIVLQILLGIGFLHEFPQPIVHRDIKPANIMVTKNKLVKICDLGVSQLKQLDTQLLTTQGRINCAGTPLYMAPECYLDHKETTQYSDMWSLGCTIIEFFTGKRIWHMENFSVTDLKNILVSQKKPNISCVPEILKKDILNCFNYVQPSSRPKAIKIILTLKNSGVTVHTD